MLVDQYMYSKMQITAEQKNLYAILWLTVDKSSNIKYARATKSNTHSINNMISILSFVIWCMAKLEDTALGRDKLSSLPNSPEYVKEKFAMIGTASFVYD